MALSFPERREGAPFEVLENKPLPLTEVVFEPRPQAPISPLLPSMNSSKPLEPLEPAPFSINGLEYKRYEKARDEARAYAAENDLRGTF